MVALRCTLLLLVVLLGNGCHRPSKPATAEECALTIFAASSLTELTEAVGRDFTKEHPACTIKFNFAASNALGLQIEAGAHAEVFLSAAEAPVDHLLRSGTVEAGSKRVLFSNRLALVSNRSSPLDIRNACAIEGANPELLAIGQPDVVPAGDYAKSYLSKIRCPDGESPWSALERRLLPMPNVRAVLSVVEQQPKVVGFVYQTDALTSGAVRTQFIVQGSDAPRIDYYGIRIGPHNQAKFSEAFLAEFTKPGVQKTIREMGFVIDQS